MQHLLARSTQCLRNNSYLESVPRSLKWRNGAEEGPTRPPGKSAKTISKTANTFPRTTMNIVQIFNVMISRGQKKVRKVPLEGRELREVAEPPAGERSNVAREFGVGKGGGLEPGPSTSAGGGSVGS